MTNYLFLPSRLRRILGGNVKRIKILCNDRFEPFIHQQSDSVRGIFNGVQFVTEGPCDLIVVLNKFDDAYKFAGLGTPLYLWLIEPPDYLQLYTSNTDLNFYDKVFTCEYLPGIAESKQIITPPFVHWHHAYSSKSRFLTNGYMPFSKLYKNQFNLEKKDKIFLIDSYMNNIPGHQKRIDFIKILSDLDIIDLFGSLKWKDHPRFINSIASFKYNVQKKYLYSLIIENQKHTVYWSEKLTDSFLALSYPIYYGSETITNFFPKGSFLRLPQLFENCKDFEAFFRENKESVNKEALLEARKLVMNDYNLLNILSKLI